MFTSLKEAGQAPNPEVIAHRSVAVPPMISPVTPEVGLFTEVTEAVPEITDQVPVSDAATELPASVAVVM